jgi:hypothetical protein
MTINQSGPMNDFSDNSVSISRKLIYQLMSDSIEPNSPFNSIEYRMVDSSAAETD